jgi:hypothetical protein
MSIAPVDPPLLELRHLQLVVPPAGPAAQVLGVLEETADPLRALEDRLIEQPTLSVGFEPGAPGQIILCLSDVALNCRPLPTSNPDHTALEVTAIRPAPPGDTRLPVRLDAVSVRATPLALHSDTHRLVDWGRALGGASIQEPVRLQRLVELLQAPERARAQAQTTRCRLVEGRWRCRHCQTSVDAGAPHCAGCDARLGLRDHELIEVTLALTHDAARRLQQDQEVSLEGESGERLLGSITRLDPGQGMVWVSGRFPELPAPNTLLIPAYNERLYRARRKTLTAMICRDPRYGLLAELLATPEVLATPRSGMHGWRTPGIRPEGAQERAAAAMAALRPGEAVMVQGPPGTGKTTVIVEAIRRRLATSPDERLLLISASNLAVDHALERLSSDPDLRLVRVARGERTGAGMERFRCDPDDLARQRQAQCCFATAATASFAALSQLHFDLVIADESNRMRVDEAIPGLHLGAAIAMVGDHRQLPPSLEGAAVPQQPGPDPELVDLLTTSIFERCWDRVPVRARHLLTLQHRMHPQIAAYVSAASYGGRLRTAPEVPRSPLLPESPLPVALHFVDTAGDRGGGERRAASGSLSNLSEARAVGRLVHLLDHRLAPGEGMAVIAMYREQVAVLREAAGRTRHRLRVDTVDAFEGREEDVVVISLVRSNPHGDLGFLRLPNRLNVAVSRARRLVAVVGDSTTLAKDPLFETLIEAARQAGGLVPAAELERVVPARERSPL